MLGHTLRVDVVKKENSSKAELNQPELGFEEKANIIGGIIEHGVKKIGYAICGYVLVDTIRKVVVASASA